MSLHEAVVSPWPGATRSRSELFAAALRGARCTLLGFTDDALPLPVERWRADADESDAAVLSHCTGSTVDVGCGPGRMTIALALAGVCALGIDVVPEAVAQTRARGASAVLRDVFRRVPGEGRWDCALLADGNIGIGGDPVRLLSRVRELTHPGGRVIVDLARPGIGLVTRTVRLQVDGMRSEPFRWAVVGIEALPQLAAQAGFEVRALRRHHSRWFAELHPAASS